MSPAVRRIAIEVGVALALIGCAVLARAAPATAPTIKPIVIGDDSGGVVGTYINWYERIAASGVPVMLTGECDSACTLVLHLPTSQVCATPFATLGFHFATYPNGKLAIRISHEMARSFYPPAVRDWYLKQKHFGPKNTVLEKNALSLGVKPCTAP